MRKALFMTRNTYHLPSVCFRVLLVKSVVFLCVLFTVMNDIISTMFNQRFMENLFRPQEIYSKKGMRTVFDRLAHASIMRLNTASMDKVCTHYFPIRPRYFMEAMKAIASMPTGYCLGALEMLQ